MNLNKFELRLRLAFSFAVVLTLVAVVGTIGVVGMMRLQEAVNQIVLRDNAKLSLAVTMSKSVEQLPVELLRIMQTTSMAKRNRNLNKVNWYTNQFDESVAAFDELNKRSTTEQESAALDQVKAQRAETKTMLEAFAVTAKSEGVDLTSAFAEADAALKQWALSANELASVLQVNTDRALVDSAATYKLARNLTVASIFVAIVLGIAITVWLTRGVQRQLGGDPAHAAQVVRTISKGDLTIDLKVASSDQNSLLASMQSMQNELRSMIAKINDGMAAVADGAQQVSLGNNELSRRTQEQASSLEEIAASMEELASTVAQNANNARHADQLSTAARAEASNGGAVVSKAITAMTEITTSSRRIADIISVIDEIAFQTNLLALNAAVEAARAGEMGRGFAVVASEVRGLAGRSATAAKEIKQLIQDSVDKVAEGAKLVNDSGQTLTAIVTAVQKVGDVVSEISLASTEQSKGIEQINTAITSIDEMTQQNAALVEESASSSESIAAEAKKLSLHMRFFKTPDQRNAPSGQRNTDTAHELVPSGRRPALALVS